MLDRVVIGKYYPTKSMIHLLNPLTKIICLFIILISNIINSNLINSIILLGLIIGLYLISHLPIKLLKNVIYSIFPLLLLIFIINLIGTKNIIFSIISSINIIIVIINLMIITMTTSLTEITYGLEHFLNPLKKFKIKPSELSLKITNFIRFIPMYLDNKERIIKKIHNHNQDLELLELKYKIKTYFEIKIKAFKLALKQLKQTTKMMDIRLYSIKEYRTNLRLNKFGVVDTLIILSHVVIFIFIVVSEVIL